MTHNQLYQIVVIIGMELIVVLNFYFPEVCPRSCLSKLSFSQETIRYIWRKKKKKNLDRNFISLLLVISLKRSLIIQVNCFLLDWIFKKHSSSLFRFQNGITTYITMCKYIYTHYSLLSGITTFLSFESRLSNHSS